ncbi:MAG TPA: GlsB/YeaQ/YmgE family stress response membrane protein [Candidatus Acidoferrales bacterium]|nr:GlsB/YeaQ/YmgE family stress response membrane protein [Candidatus Acidoferrales bacterium]
MTYLLWVIVIGILAGWIAGKIMRGSGFGLLGDLIVGVIGSLLGSFIFGLLGLGAYGLIGRLVVAVIGALILLWLIRLVKRR